MIIMALAATAQFAQMRQTGLRPLLLGALLWATLGRSSLGLQRLPGQW